MDDVKYILLRAAIHRTMLKLEALQIIHKRETGRRFTYGPHLNSVNYDESDSPGAGSHSPACNRPGTI